MQARDVMTRPVVTVGPDTSAKYAAEVMAQRGFAALPVLDDGRQLVGIVAEADVLRDRIPQDPRLHARRDQQDGDIAHRLLVRGVMTAGVRTVPTSADIADIAKLFVDERLRSVPVVNGGELVGIVSRRDLLRTVGRPDTEIHTELLRLVEGYTGELDSWTVEVREGIATIRRIRGIPDPAPEVEERTLTALARTIGGVVDVRVLPATADDGAGDPTAPAHAVADGHP